MSRGLNKLCTPHNFLTAISLLLKLLNTQIDVINKANNICHSPLRKQFTEWQILVGSFLKSNIKRADLKRALDLYKVCDNYENHILCSDEALLESLFRDRNN